MISLTDVRFDDAGYHLDGDSPDGGARYWTSTEGDQVGLYLFLLRPDIAADLQDLDGLRAFYRQTAARNGLGLLELETFTSGGSPVVRSLLKAPLQPSGWAYVGALTIPFRDFSFVIRVQCNEDGVRGVREAAVLDLLFKRGEVTRSITGDLIHWAADPYDAALSGPMVMNRAELEVYDAMFPAHALTRTRRTLNHLQRTLLVAPGLREEPPFAPDRT